MAYVDFLSAVHRRTARDYLERVTGHPKAEAMRVARRYDREYWDGDRKYGYGGHRYDGRWRPVARAMAERYGLKAGDRVLDVGCGKAFLLHDLALEVPGLAVAGLDLSAYALADAPAGVRGSLVVGDAGALPFADRSFDLVLSVNALHNLFCHRMVEALREIGRVGRGRAYVAVESYRNEEEQANLMAWVLTGRCFFSPEEWEWFFRLAGYAGDHSFVFFE